jgi:hypothetical protein
MVEFKEWAPIARLNREIVITEKIDGTNGVVYVGEDGAVLAGSRSRWLTAATGDNHGFAAWVIAHADELRELGPGYHYGEWYGSGVNKRHYGLEKGEKRWALFNTHRWAEKRPACCDVVPVLYAGPMSMVAVNEALASLREYGSRVTPGFRNPEGVVIYHTASKTLFKVTLEKDDVPKSMVASDG